MADVNILVDALRCRGIRDERVLDAIATVDRARFVPAAEAGLAWDDSALPIGSGQTISQPYIVALMTAALSLQGEESVLEIGTGSGYQTAILARLCKQVVTVERIDELQARAKRVLAELGFENITYRVGDGTLGSPGDGPFEEIIVTAGAPQIPKALYDQLAEGGRLVLPVGTQETQELMVVEKTPKGPRQQSLCPCRFVPLIGEQGWQDL